LEPERACSLPAPTQNTGTNQAATARFKQENLMSNFQSFRNAVLEDDDLQEVVIS
jgi:hypothetical protein